MWSLQFLPDPLTHRHQHHHRAAANETSSSLSSSRTRSFLVVASVPVHTFFGTNHQGEQDYGAFRQGGRAARVALADACARHFLTHQVAGNNNNSATIGVDLSNSTCQLETLDKALVNTRRRRGGNGNRGPKAYPPYVVERSDFWCDDSTGNDDHSDKNKQETLHLMLRLIVHQVDPSALEDSIQSACTEPCQKILSSVFNYTSSDDSAPHFRQHLMANIACVALQQRLRSTLSTMNAVAFLADGAVLPRKSGSSDAPMASPPAVPFQAPSNTHMARSVTVELGALAKFLPRGNNELSSQNGSTAVSLSGLVIPAGITLICGGGYHGKPKMRKSTMLQAIAIGVYDKIPFDGREYCVSVPNAVSVRAEDGRYVNNCNISAFISNLPTPPGVKRVLDTQRFSSRDASGSTSQAANVIEAIEMGASAMLVDEDISAANFMARDGRMRSLVMDESITPLLYRVNGLYNTHRISSVVVVGGVGDWLDVPHNVLLLDKYVASDATKKAQSISYQFSYGHVQYAGKGVVHRLDWDKKGTPIPRRPVDSFAEHYDSNVVVSLLDGGHALSLHKELNDDEDDAMQIIDDEDDGCIDASRIEQFLSRRQLYGAGVCAAWLLQQAPIHPELGLRALLQKLDCVLDNGGMKKIVDDLKETTNGALLSRSWLHLVETVGFLERPRSFEIGQVLTRLHGIQLEELPPEDDGAEEAARLEEERKKQALAELWAKRRSKKEFP
ncbi:MAG: hypothetical protein SGILL_005431 [Bacillariaceae sp.]